MTDKRTSTGITMGPIATKVLGRLRKAKTAGVVDLGAFRAGKQDAEELQKSAVTAEALSDLHPAHALFVHVQNQVSIMVETLSQLPEFDKLSDVINAAEDRYLPGGPPMSPLTKSHFTMWAVFDAAVGVRRETLGSVLLAVCPHLGVHRAFLDVLKIMQTSRLGLYVREANEGDDIFRLKEFVTGDRFSCLVPSGWVGSDGELWLGRVVSPLADGMPHLFVTTPYVVIDPGAMEWEEYFARTLSSVTPANYATLMKRPIDRHHWNEFIFEAYVNHETEAIFLRGLPDVATSRPHSGVNS